MKTALEKARAAIDSGDADKIKAALNELEQASHAFSKVLYESAAARGAAGGEAGGEAGPQAAAGGASPGDDEAIDAEFEVKDN